MLGPDDNVRIPETRIQSLKREGGPVSDGACALSRAVEESRASKPVDYVVGLNVIVVLM